MREYLGQAAGTVWHFLHTNGPSTVMTIKLALNMTNGQLFLALGWLSREDKIEIHPQDNTYTIALKS